MGTAGPAAVARPVAGMGLAGSTPADVKASSSTADAGVRADGGAPSAARSARHAVSPRREGHKPSPPGAATMPSTSAATLAPSPPATFAEAGVCTELVDACTRLNFTKPTPIQAEALPLALAGRDVIGLAQTGSGKTVAFTLPVLQGLLDAGSAAGTPYAVVMAPTRELAVQIAQVFVALGGDLGARVVTLTGGQDMMEQAVALAKRPHVVVATPGRLVDHLEHTKGFSMRSVRFLVLDEADRLLNMDFEAEIDAVLSVLPRERRTFLFSATMTSQVRKLQRACLVKPAKVSVSDKYGTVATLVQSYAFMPAKHKDCYLAYILHSLGGKTAIVFVDTQATAGRLVLMLRALGYAAIAIHGGLAQSARLEALGKFKAGDRAVLVATDVASRGLDIPSVDAVINFDVPSYGKDYIHRVGRTARAGRSGLAVSLVSQYDVENFQRVEGLIGKKLPKYDAEEATVLLLAERVAEAQRYAAAELREAEEARRERASRGGGGRGGGGPKGINKRRGAYAADADVAALDGERVQGVLSGMERGRGKGGRARDKAKKRRY
ncbi:hypothetical protein MMPV_009190 [Pyropia vietnamensis]